MLCAGCHGHGYNFRFPKKRKLQELHAIWVRAMPCYAAEPRMLVTCRCQFTGSHSAPPAPKLRLVPKVSDP